MNKFIFKYKSNFCTFKKVDKPHVTFIGLGNMGYSMAINLLNSNKYSISGFDLNNDVQEEFSKHSNAVKTTLETSIQNSKYIITVLPNTDNVKSAINNFKSYIKSSSLEEVYLIDSSTICPIETRNISKELSEYGNSLGKKLNFTDAPISGGVIGAKNATLTFMIGADNVEKFNTVKQFLNPMGKNFFNCESIGNGQVAKICNNLALGITTAGISESIALGKKLGIDDKILAQIMSVSSAYCWSLNVNSPVPGVVDNSASNREYEKGFNIDLMLKDMNLGLQSAKALNQNLDIADVVSNLYNDVLSKGKGKKDFSYIYQYLLNKNLL